MTTVVVSVAVLGAAVALLALRILLVRGGEFRGTCASNNPYLRNEVGECWACGKNDDADIEGCEHQATRTSTLLLSRLRKAR